MRCKMMTFDIVKNEFIKYGGVLKTSELNDLGLSSRQIKKLVKDNLILKIKHGFYELAEECTQEEIIIARLFPHAVIFLESAMMYYSYTDRIPTVWQIAVNRYSKSTQYDIDYPRVKPFYLEPKFLEIGVEKIQIGNINVKVYDRERTVCDTLRYEKKLEKEVFNNVIQRYVKDPKKNVRKLFEYAEIFNIKNKVQTYIGVWL